MSQVRALRRNNVGYKADNLPKKLNLLKRILMNQSTVISLAKSNDFIQRVTTFISPKGTQFIIFVCARVAHDACELINLLITHGLMCFSYTLGKNVLLF